VEWLYSALVSFVLTIVVGLIAYRRIKNTIWDTINAWGQQFVEEAINPTVSKAFGIIGSQGGTAKATKELQGKMAKGFLNNQMGELRMLGEQVLGLDFDDLIDQYGATTVMKAVGGFMGAMQGKGGGGLLSGFLSRQKGHNSSGVPEM